MKALGTDQDIACITSDVNNGKTVDLPAVSYVAVGVAGVALVATGFSALGAAMASGGGSGGPGSTTPSFTETVGWFQGMAMNGMLSVNYPPVYRSFAKNFAFSTGLIPWTSMQNSIDRLRAATGGNVTQDNVQTLQNTTLSFSDGSKSSVLRRALDKLVRDISTNINSTSPADSSDSRATIRATVSGIEAYAEQLTVPQANTFMTVLLIVAIVVAAIVVGILLLKLVLEIWALFGSFPKGLTGFRTHYWGTMARTIVNLILIVYG